MNDFRNNIILSVCCYPISSKFVCLLNVEVNKLLIRKTIELVDGGNTAALKVQNYSIETLKKLLASHDYDQRLNSSPRVSFESYFSSFFNTFYDRSNTQSHLYIILSSRSLYKLSRSCLITLKMKKQRHQPLVLKMASSDHRLQMPSRIPSIKSQKDLERLTENFR